MKKLILIFLLCAVLGCDDGDIITTEIDFDDIPLNVCDIISNGTTSSYVFYKLDSDAGEGLVLTLTTAENLLVPENTYGPFALSTTNVFEYRIFNGTPATDYFCSTIPPSSPTVRDVYSATDGEIFIQNIIFSQDDDDGIPASIEGGDDVQSDADGIPDYLDIDDDGDNVPTSQEGVVIVDGVIDLVNSLDTDNDGILNYLDPDDDGDGIPTKQEDVNRDLMPANDINPNEALPNYLLSNIAIPANPVITRSIENTIIQVNSLNVFINNLTIDNGAETITTNPFIFGIVVLPEERVLFN